MTGWMRTAAATLLGLALVYGVARASLASYTPAHRRYSTPAVVVAETGTPGVAAASIGRTALLRLSWRTRGEPVHACRTLSQAEIDALPQHMRREEVCETRVEPYRLQVGVDGQTLLVDTIHAAGSRQDRPLYIYYDLPLPAGEYAIDVRFEQMRSTDTADDRDPDDGVDAADSGQESSRDSRSNDDARGDSGDDRERSNDGQGSSSEGAADSDAEAAGLLVHRSTVRLEPGEIALVTYDAGTRSLILRRPSTEGSSESAAP